MRIDCAGGSRRAHLWHCGDDLAILADPPSYSLRLVRSQDRLFSPAISTGSKSWLSCLFCNDDGVARRGFTERSVAGERSPAGVPFASVSRRGGTGRAHNCFCGGTGVLGGGWGRECGNCRTKQTIFVASIWIPLYLTRRYLSFGLGPRHVNSRKSVIVQRNPNVDRPTARP